MIADCNDDEVFVMTPVDRVAELIFWHHTMPKLSPDKGIVKKRDAVL
jgi:hypothetical protein